ncbi:Tnt-2 [Aphelenchoides besseyi]|nr:Tnt-2 [Aphelenchoides besseyi]
MADEEQYDEESEYEEEEEEEEEIAETPAAETEEPQPADDEPAVPEPESQAVEETPKLRRAPPKEEVQEEQSLTEAEQAMLAAKKRHEEEQEAKMADYEQRRLEEREQIERDLRELKEKQIERKKQRQIEEQEFAERRRVEEERRRQQEEERKARIEAEKARREEEKLKRQQMIAGGFVTSTVGNQRKSRTAEQQAEAKRNYLATLQKPDVSGLLPNDLKAKIKQLYQRILKLEGEKYDLEKRKERQEYDLKELTERQSQHARNKALASGVEVEENEGRTLPPKINVASKFDRQKDHRAYGDRRNLFENPVVKKPPSIARGTAKPPSRKANEELEALRKNLEGFRYVEQVSVEGARPPVDPKPLQLPSSDFDEGDQQQQQEQPADRYRPTSSSLTSVGKPNLLSSSSSTYNSRQSDLFNNAGSSILTSSSPYSSSTTNSIYNPQASSHSTHPFAYSSTTYNDNPVTSTSSRASPPANNNRFGLNRRGSAIDLQTIDHGARTRRSDSLTNSTNDVPSVRESWASGYLRRRKEPRLDEQSDTGPIGVFAAKANPTTESSSTTVTRLNQAPPAEFQASQHEFMNRLLAAHKAVDNLLNRRGLRSEDESKFLQKYEWVPVIDEEPQERVSPPFIPPRFVAAVHARRSVSKSDSDSGFSMDSDHSNDEIEEITADECALERDTANERCDFSILLNAAIVTEQTELCTKMCKKRNHTSIPKTEDDHSKLKPSSEASKRLNEIVHKPEADAQTNTMKLQAMSREDANLNKSIEKKTFNDVKPTVSAPKTRSVLAMCSTHKNGGVETVRLQLTPKKEPSTATQQPKTITVDSLKPIAVKARQPSQLVQNFTEVKLKPLNHDPLKKQSTTKRTEQPQHKKTETAKKPPPRLLRQQTAPTLPTSQLRSVGRLDMQKTDVVTDSQSIRNIERPKRTVLQDRPAATQTTTARFRQPPISASSVEISVQHCSFYETSRSFTEPKEKCLRIHLRLTSRAERKATTSIVLPTNERTHRAILRISMPSKSEHLNSLTSTELQRKSVEPIPRRKIVDTPQPLPYNAPKLRIVTDTSVKLMQEKLKRHQAQAELQNLRGNLRRIPRTHRSSLTSHEQRKSTAIKTTAGVNKGTEVRKRRVKRQSRKPKSEDSTKIEMAPPKNANRRAQQEHVFTSESLSTTNEPKDKTSTVDASTDLATEIIKSVSSSSINSHFSHASHRSNKQRNPQRHDRVFRIDDWERRLLEEFRRLRNIPILEAVYRQVFCFRCVACHLLPEARAQARAFFIRRKQPNRWPLSTIGPCELIQLLTIWKRKSIIQIPPLPISQLTTLYATMRNPFGVSLRRVNWKQRRPYIPFNQRKPKKWTPRWRLNLRSEIDEEEEEDEMEPVSEAPTLQPAEDNAAANEDAAPADEPETEGDENEAPEDSTVEEKRTRRTVPTSEPDPTTMTEAELALHQAKKRQEMENEMKLKDSESRRKAELEQIEQELEVLKQRQAERRKLRQIEEAEFAERRKADEERHRKEEQERKAHIESEKIRRAEEKFKRQQQMAGFAGVEAGEGKNFVIGEKVAKPEKEEKKSGQNYMNTVNRPIDVSNMLPNDIKAKIKQLHARIVKLEGEKYDLEKRQNVQEIDLRELFEREKQVARNKALKAGVEPTEENTNRPPKINVASKFDRQVDRRTYTDKRTLFQNPYIKPPPSIARGSGRPPPQWGVKNTEELDAIRKTNEDRPKYKKILPCPVIPMQIPTEEFDPSLAEKVPKRAAANRSNAKETSEENGEVRSTTENTTELEIIEEPVDS